MLLVIYRDYVLKATALLHGVLRAMPHSRTCNITLTEDVIAEGVAFANILSVREGG